MSTIDHKKSCIDKIKRNHFKNLPDSQIILQMIYNWTKEGELRLDEFKELLNYSRESITRNGKNPYKGNEDPEGVLP